MDTALFDVLVNSGTGFLVVLLIIFGFLVPKPSVDRLLKENEDLKTALALERQRSDDAASSAAVTNQLIGAMKTLAEQSRDRDQRQLPPGKDAEV